MGLFSKSKRTKAPSDFDKMLNEQLTIIEASELEPILWNNESKIYCQSIMLNGYRSLSLIITGNLKIATIEGCTLVLTTENNQYQLKSDSDIVKGDYSNSLNIGVTNFDADLEDDLISFLAKETIQSAKIETRIGQLKKRTLTFDYPNINQELFNKIVNLTEEDLTEEE